MTAENARPDEAAQNGEAAYEAFIRANLKRNFAANFLHGMLGMTGFRLLFAPTFIPAYLHALTGSDSIVGLGLALQQLGGMVSPVVGAAKVEHKRRVLPIAMLLGGLLRIPVLLMALSAWFLSGHWLVWSILVLLLAMGLFSGAQRVVFQLLLAKMIPTNLRGRLQAVRNVTGGIIAAAMSYFAGTYLIDHNVLGNGYATTFLLAFVLTSLGLSAFRMLAKEPVPPTLRARTPMRQRMGEVRVLLAKDRDFRNFLIAQGLAMGGRIAAPFYILHAISIVGMSGASLGLFTLVYLGADTISNLAWGHFGDKSGFRSSFLAALGLFVGSTVILLVTPAVPMLLVAFFGLGAAQAGYMMSTQTMVLEFGGRDDVAMRLGLSSTVEAGISTMAPLAGGLLAAAAGYPTVFAISIALMAAAFVVLLFVREPRGVR